MTDISLYYIDFILEYNLLADIKAYDTLLRGTVNSWDQIGALGLQGIGSNCMYAMGMLVGAYVIRFVPEVASWLIPGSGRAGAGHAAGGMAKSIVIGGGGYVAGAAATAVVGTMTGGANMAASVVGAAQQSHSDGGTPAQQVGRTIFAQTGLGASYSHGADSARSINNVGKSDSNYRPGGSNEN